MTVGIILNNKNSGVAIADSKVMIDNRLGDAANKLITIKAKDYEGAVVGAGSGQALFSLFKYMKTLKKKNFEDFLKCSRDYWFKQLMHIEEQLMDSGKNKMDTISKSFKDDANPMQEQMALESIMQEIEFVERAFASECLAAVFDRQQKCVRKYSLTNYMYKEEAAFECVIGGGFDTAYPELLRLIPGAPLSKLDIEEIAFFAMCTYVRATQNIGVGGPPKIALINSKGVKKVNKGKSVALTNIVGAYMADIIARPYAEEQVLSVLKGKADYSEVGEKIGLEGDSITNLLVPLDSWISCANRQRYNK